MIALAAAPTELTTAASDLVVASAALVAAASLRRRGRPRSVAAGWWLASLLALAAAALGGAAYHGVVLTDALAATLWRVTTLALAATVTTFALGVLVDWRGPNAARRALPLLVALVVAATVAGELSGGSFLPTVLLEGAVMLPTLAICLYRSATQRQRGPAALAVGLVVTLVAALLQSLGIGAFSLVWPFDHNGLFHLIQLVGLTPLVIGMHWSLGVRSSGDGAILTTDGPADQLRR